VYGRAIRLCFLAALLLPGTAPSPLAADTGLPIPRFVSVRAGEARMRTGPGDQYPIDWVYNRRGLPVEILAEYEHWRKVRDRDGVQGWMHKNLLSGQRTVLVTGEVRSLRSEPSARSEAVARLAPGVIAELRRCDTEWCEVETAGKRGWLRRTEFWGTYAEERIE
jgi:SH3-like domain-containing protein